MKLAQIRREFIVLLVFLAGCPITAMAADGASAERASINLGLFITDRETNTRIDAESGDPGTDVDLEKDLGLDS